MKEIRIFLASSYELEPDRARIGNLIRELNDEYEQRYIHLRLVKWEDLDLFYNPQGKQTQYDSRIRTCELFIGLFWHVAGMYTVHEVEIARKHLKAENLLIFRKTAEFKPDHEGSEDEKRFLELHPDAKDDVRELDEFLKNERYETYPDFGVLRELLTAKLKDYCDTVEITDEDRKRGYSPNTLQIHVTASPEAEPDLARLGDLVRHLDENSKSYCRVKLIPNISDSDMFVSLCHTSAPESMPDEIRTAIKYSSGEGGRPRLYFCLKYVSENDKQTSLKQLEKLFEDEFRHYPDRYSQAAEMKLHFLMQLALLKKPTGSVALTVDGGAICQQLGNSNYPLLSCEDMVPLQKDPDYRSLKAKRARLLNEIEELKERDRLTDEDLSRQIYRLHQELAEVDRQLDDKRDGYFRLTRTLEEYVGKEQDEQIAEIRDLIARGMLEQAVKKLPDSQTQRQSREERKERRLAEDRRAYEVCKLTIDCLAASSLRKNRDEILSLYELLIDIAAEDLRDAEKEAEVCYSFGHFLGFLGFIDRALKYLEKALATFEELPGEHDPAILHCHNDIGGIFGQMGDFDRELECYEKMLAIIKKQPEEHDPAIATCYNNISGAWSEKGDHDRALEYLEKALAIRKMALGEDDPDTAISYNNIGLELDAKGDYDRALEYLEKALAICKKVHGENHHVTATCYNNIGRTWSKKDDFARELEYLEKALAIRKMALGEDDPATAISYNNIGMAWYRKGDYDRALEYLEKALTIWKMTYGENHYHTQVFYKNIGLAWYQKGDIDKAFDYFEKAKATRSIE